MSNKGMGNNKELGTINISNLLSGLSTKEQGNIALDLVESFMSIQGAQGEACLDSMSSSMATIRNFCRSED